MDYEGMNLNELRDVAAKHGVKSIVKYRKPQLIELLKELDTKAAQEAEKAAQTPKKRGRRPKSAEQIEIVEAATEQEKIAETPPEQAEPAKAELAMRQTEASPEQAGVQLGEKKRRGRPKKVEIIPDEDAYVLTPPEGEDEYEQPADEDDDDRDIGERSTAQGWQGIEPAEAPENGQQKRQLFDANSEADSSGILEIHPEGYGFLRSYNYQSSDEDIYVSPGLIRKFNVKTGDKLAGFAIKREGEKYPALIYIKDVNGEKPETARFRKQFEYLTPVYPHQRLTLETDSRNYAMRLIDLIAPVGRGQRGLIVSQPKSGKTTLLKSIAQSIVKNSPDVQLIVLLIDERPEEVTDMQHSINADVVYSTFDMPPENHTKVAEIVLERAMRLVEHGKDVVILLDSITRLARAYNLTVQPTGRTLSGGLESSSLHRPKKFFGAARKIKDGGSLTILATALVETGSRMDDVIFEEFKGTGNMEVHLDRSLSERRIFPAIDVYKSGTRKEELLLNYDELTSVWNIRRALGSYSTADVTEYLLSRLIATKTNADFVKKINAEFKDNTFSIRNTGGRRGGGNNNGDNYY